MFASQPKDSADGIGIGIGTRLIFPAFLSLALLGILLSVPQPAIHVNQPFKVELLLSLFLMAFLAALHRSSQQDLPRFRNNEISTSIAIAFGGFVIWSAASFIWGASFGAVSHHTLLWALYLIFFLIFACQGWPKAKLPFITTTFVIVALILGFLCVFDYITVVEFTSSEGLIRIRYGKYAELLVTLSPILWAAAIYQRDRRRRMLLVTAGVFSWLTVMLSLSKGAFLAGLIGFVFFFAGSAIFSGRRIRKRVLLFAGIWLAVTIATQGFFSFFSAAPSTTNYITGAADQTRSTSTMRVFTWKVGGQMAEDNWLAGVGADNFGVSFNAARANFRSENPNDTTEEIAEDYLAERAHNEPLQVLAELGVIGFALFILPLLLFAFFLVKTLIARRRLSMMLIAAAAGMTAFFVSSMFSSFSFRSAQNGVVFFMVFAIAVNRLANARRSTASDAPRPLTKALYVTCWLVVVLMAVFCTTKVVAQYHSYLAERTPKNDSRAGEHFRIALRADPEYAGAYLQYAGRAELEGNHVGAARLTRKAIDHGIGTTPIYATLVKRQIAAGDAGGAEATFREAISVYPRSVYIRTAFIVFLEDQGKLSEAAEQSAIARSQDLPQANGWYMLIRNGSVPAFYRSRTDKEFAAPADLLPPNAVLQYLDKIKSATE